MLSWYEFILTQGTRLVVRRPLLVAKGARKVKFDVRDDPDSDDATVRAEPSQHRVQQNLPVHPELSPSPPTVDRVQQSGNKKGEFPTFLLLKRS